MNLHTLILAQKCVEWLRRCLPCLLLCAISASVNPGIPPSYNFTRPPLFNCRLVLLPIKLFDKLFDIARSGNSSCELPIPIFSLAYLSSFDPSIIWLIPPFGASMVLVMGVHESPLAQPKNILFGHVLSALSGVVIFALLGSNFVGCVFEYCVFLKHSKSQYV